MDKYLVKVSVVAIVTSPSYGDAVEDMANTVRNAFENDSWTSEVTITETRARLQRPKENKK